MSVALPGVISVSILRGLSGVQRLAKFGAGKTANPCVRSSVDQPQDHRLTLLQRDLAGREREFLRLDFDHTWFRGRICLLHEAGGLGSRCRDQQRNRAGRREEQGTDLAFCGSLSFSFLCRVCLPMFEHLIHSDRARVLVHREFDLLETQVPAAALPLTNRSPRSLKGCALSKGIGFLAPGVAGSGNAKISDRAAYILALPC